MWITRWKSGLHPVIIIIIPSQTVFRGWGLLFWHCLSIMFWFLLLILLNNLSEGNHYLPGECVCVCVWWCVCVCVCVGGIIIIIIVVTVLLLLFNIIIFVLLHQTNFNAPFFQIHVQNIPQPLYNSNAGIQSKIMMYPKKNVDYIEKWPKWP